MRRCPKTDGAALLQEVRKMRFEEPWWMAGEASDAGGVLRGPRASGGSGGWIARLALVVPACTSAGGKAGDAASCDGGHNRGSPQRVSVEVREGPADGKARNRAMRFFNTAGPVRPDDHYCIPPLERFDLDEVLTLVRMKKYFVLHAPRQTGKTPPCWRCSTSTPGRLDRRSRTGRGRRSGRRPWASPGW